MPAHSIPGPTRPDESAYVPSIQLQSAVAILGPAGQLIWVNQEFSEHWGIYAGCDQQELLSAAQQRLLPHEVLEPLSRAVIERKSGQFSGVLARRVHGTTRLSIELIGLDVAQDSPKGLMIICRQLCEQGDSSSSQACKTMGSKADAISSSNLVETSSPWDNYSVLTQAVEGAGQGVWVHFQNQGSTRVSTSWLKALGYLTGASFFQAVDWRDLVLPEDLPAFTAYLRSLDGVPDADKTHEFRMLHCDGSSRWVMAAGTCVQGATPAERYTTGLFVDVNARRAAEEALWASARTDDLTKLPNRLRIGQLISACVARAKNDPSYRFGVLFLDFDRFKRINDTLGHGAGDELLRQIGGRLRLVLREEDFVENAGGRQTVAGRLGGDEFVVVLNSLSQEDDACRVAERLLQVLGRPYEIAGHAIQSTVSIGIAIGMGSNCSSESMLRDADAAMYEAKRRGRACYVVFDEKILERTRSARALEVDLRSALACGEQITPAFQPIRCVRTGRVTGVEVLARWSHPEKGEIAPDEFVALAEACGQLEKLTWLLIEHACAVLHQWDRFAGALSPARFSVNISKGMLSDAEMPAKLLEVLRCNDVPAGRLQLEVRESGTGRDVSHWKSLMDLRAAGASVALDGFGLGASALFSLESPSVDVVKVDKACTQKISPGNHQWAVVQAAVQVAESAGIQVLAQGVETELQLEYVKRLGCTLAQGYHLGEPMNQVDFTDMLLAQASADADEVGLP